MHIAILSSRICSYLWESISLIFLFQHWLEHRNQRRMACFGPNNQSVQEVQSQGLNLMFNTSAFLEIYSTWVSLNSLFK